MADILQPISNAFQDNTQQTCEAPARTNKLLWSTDAYMRHQGSVG